MNNLTIENAKLIFRNFEGRATDYNSEGDRNVAVVIENEEDARALMHDGWNVREMQPREPGEDPWYFIKATISYKVKRPVINMITSRSKTPLAPDTVGCLDYADIKTADIVLSPYHWEVKSRQGVKAFVKTLYVVIEEDEFSSKYADLEFPTE